VEVVGLAPDVEPLAHQALGPRQLQEASTFRQEETEHGQRGRQS
jgi:hypothetical protein